MYGSCVCKGEGRGDGLLPIPKTPPLPYCTEGIHTPKEAPPPPPHLLFVRTERRKKKKREGRAGNETNVTRRDRDGRSRDETRHETVSSSLSRDQVHKKQNLTHNFDPNADILIYFFFETVSRDKVTRRGRLVTGPKGGSIRGGQANGREGGGVPPPCGVGSKEIGTTRRPLLPPQRSPSLRPFPTGPRLQNLLCSYICFVQCLWDMQGKEEEKRGLNTF